MVDAEYRDFVRGIQFELVQPGARRRPDHRFVLERDGGWKASLLELPGIPTDALNTRLEASSSDIYDVLRPVLDMPRMESFAIGSILNLGVRRLRPARSYVVPPNESFALAARKRHAAKSNDWERAIPFFVPESEMDWLDGQGAIARLEELRTQGVRFAVFPHGTFAWLTRRPEFQEHLRTTARPVLENKHVRIFELYL
jgi:hypothetical protein